MFFLSFFFFSACFTIYLIFETTIYLIKNITALKPRKTKILYNMRITYHYNSVFSIWYPRVSCTCQQVFSFTKIRFKLFLLYTHFKNYRTKTVNRKEFRSRLIVFNTFLAYVPILYTLKTRENLWFSGVFRGYKMGTLVRNGLMLSLDHFMPKYTR